MPRTADGETARVERLAGYPHDVVEEARQDIAAVALDGAPDPPSDHGIDEVGRREPGFFRAHFPPARSRVTVAATNDAALGSAAPDLQSVDRLEEVAAVRRAVDGHVPIRWVCDERVPAT